MPGEPPRRTLDRGCPARLAPRLRLHQIHQIGETAAEWRPGGPQVGAVGGGDRVRGHREGAGDGAAGAQDLDVVAARRRGGAIGSPALAGVECAGEVGPVARDPAGQARVGRRDQRGIGGG